MASNTRIQGRGDYLFVVKLEPVTPQFEQPAFVAKVDRIIRRSPLALYEPGLSECYGATEEEAATAAGEAVDAWLTSHAGQSNEVRAARPARIAARRGTR